MDWLLTKHLLHSLNRQFEETDKQIEAINRARSLSQTGVTSKLRALRADWVTQVGASLPALSCVPGDH